MPHEHTLTAGNVSVRSRQVARRLEQASELFKSESFQNPPENRAPVQYEFTGLSADKTEFSITDSAASFDVQTEDDRWIVSSHHAAAVFFFEQTIYTVQIRLEEAKEARIFSPLSSLTESASWDNVGKLLTLPLSFDNDLGDFELCWEWTDQSDEKHTGSMRAQVFSYKLDVYSHFRWMLAQVEERFSWLNLDLLRKTTWGWDYNTDSDGSSKTWLTIFLDVRESMTGGFRRLTQQHRRRLVPETRMMQADRIRKIPVHCEERIKEGIMLNPRRRFAIERKTLSADTPENRYMKHILIHALAGLNDVIETLSAGRDEDDNPVVSDIFIERLNEWAEEWTLMLQHRFWKGIGAFHGLRRESLVLSQDPLYAGIRRSWYLLQSGLKLALDSRLQGGIQNAAQLYEIWCLVKLDRFITDHGWEPSASESRGFREIAQDEGDILEQSNPGTGEFCYRHQDNDKAELHMLFQPNAGANPVKKAGAWQGVMAVPVNQQPDIVLRLRRNDLPHKPVYTWIFDAKYRISRNRNKNDDVTESAPNDALNQMHRYRDAILWTQDKERDSLTRESLGGFVLYPGEADKDHRQYTSIDRTNIGALPFQPTDKVESVAEPMKAALQKLLSVPEELDDALQVEEENYNHVPAVKRPFGIIGFCTVRKYMDDTYWKTCRLYRLPVSKCRDLSIDPADWNYIAVKTGKKDEFRLFPVLSSDEMSGELVRAEYRRISIPESRSSFTRGPYRLFRLGTPVIQTINGIRLRKGQVAVSVDIE